MTQIKKICAAAALFAAFIGGSSSIIEAGRQTMCRITSTQIECEAEHALRQADMALTKAEALVGPVPVPDHKAFEAFLAE